VPTRRRRRSRPHRRKSRERRTSRARSAPYTAALALGFSYPPLAAAVPGLRPGGDAGRHWFFATDPTRYHWDTLFVKGKELWNGVRNSAAQRYLKQAHKGDHVVCYHGPPARSAYALAAVASEPYPDPRAPGEKLLAVDLKSVHLLPRAVPLKELKTNRALRRMKFLAKQRLAVTPLTAQEYKEILLLAGLPPVPPFR